MQLSFAGRDITLKAATRGQMLADANWIAFEADGFSDMEAARSFGEHLRQSVQLAGLAARLGVDTGQDLPGPWFNNEHAVSQGWLPEGHRLVGDVHGLAVLPDDGTVGIFGMWANISVKENSVDFFAAVSEVGENGSMDFGLANSAMRLMNVALINPDPLARMVLAFSCVEEIGQDQKWSTDQEDLIVELAKAVEAGSTCTAQERAEVAKAVRGLYPLSLRQGVLRVLAQHSLSHLKKEWDRLYGIRSGLFHGTARLSDPAILEAAEASVALCARIILAIVESRGTTVPTIAATRYPN